MSKFDTKLQKWIIPMPVSEDCQTLICHTDKNKVVRQQVRYIMSKLSNEEDSKLDRNMSIYKTVDNKRFEINRTNVICWGNIDFDIYGDDMEQLRDLIVNTDIVHIPADYDVKSHCCYSPVKMYRTTETVDVGLIAQYYYGKLGKPDKVVIFKKTIKK